MATVQVAGLHALAGGGATVQVRGLHAQATAAIVAATVQVARIHAQSVVLPTGVTIQVARLHAQTNVSNGLSARAGADLVNLQSFTSVTLDGSSSTGAAALSDPLTGREITGYTWRQVANGAPVQVLDEGDGPIRTYYPTPASSGYTILWELSVTDGSSIATDTANHSVLTWLSWVLINGIWVAIPTGPVGPPPPPVVPPVDAFYVSGSSTAAGVNSSGEDVSFWLAEDFSRPVTKAGYQGELSAHAAAWFNAIKAELTITGNSIPAGTTPVTVTAHNFRGTAAGSASIHTGALNGIPVTLSWASNVWSVARITAASSATPSPPGSLFTADIGVGHDRDIIVLIVGKNTLTGSSTGLSEALSDLAAMVAFISSTPKRYLVSTHWCNQINGDPAHGVTGAERDRIVAFNTAVRTTYASSLIDICAYLASPQAFTDAGLTPTANDVAAQAGGDVTLSYLPPSLSSDFQHLNRRYGYRQFAQKVIGPRVVARNWFPRRELPRIIADWDPATLTLANGANVTSWAPAAGSVETAPLVPVTTAPTFVAADSTLNGFPTVNFASASSQALDTGAWAAAYDTPITVICLWNRVSPSVAGNPYSGRGSVYAYMGGLSTGALVIGAGTPSQMTITPAVEGWFLQAAIFNGVSSELHLNSQAVVTGTTGDSTSTAGLPGVRMASNAAGTGSFLNGRIARWIAFDGALTAAEYAEVVGALQAKYFPTSSGLGISPLGISALGT